MLIFRILISPLYSEDYKSTEDPKIAEGALDLRDWSGLKSETIFLDGDWEFYWNAFLLPENQAAPKREKSGFLRSPE